MPSIKTCEYNSSSYYLVSTYYVTTTKLQGNLTMNENLFRIFAALILFTGIGISSYFRRKADRESGEKISRKVDGTVMMNLIRIGGLVLWFSPIVYLINPHWMAWSKLGLPEWARWLGVALGIVCVFG